MVFKCIDRIESTRVLHAGLDVGSTTAKVVLLDGEDNVLFSRYQRHLADTKTVIRQLVDEIVGTYPDSEMTIAIAGSGGIALAESMGVSFAQEIVACSTSISYFFPKVDVCIELGGEDAKLTFFDEGGADQRMNETCAGGTGAFIDQMAALLKTDAAGLNDLAREHETLYPIASRCGVFAKTDIQPLMNEGASKADLAASIFQAIVNQTLSGLACGRRVEGNVAFVGGPLHFLPELRRRFIDTLALRPEQCFLPDNPHLFVALGAALMGKKNSPFNMKQFSDMARYFFASTKDRDERVLRPLFIDKWERDAFGARHVANKARSSELGSYQGRCYLGIDVGSTTTKAVLIGESGEILFSRYGENGGEPLQNVHGMLVDLYEELPRLATICSSGVTGYGEHLIRKAFGIDIGEVETVAHAKAADFFLPGVEFVIDIGGQDMKCLHVADGVVQNVFLNEACSSGCGSFLQTFAESLQLSLADFASSALESTFPVDLGSRCTVFMNSRVRQAQKEGAVVSDIAAGLAYSVVKNALYKVLKIHNADELGRKIVVQGGAFLNDALLRAFELSINREVVRPDIAGLMGAFGVALLAQERWSGTGSTLVDPESIGGFTASTKTTRCLGCGNRCILTINTFDDGRDHISGNRCEKGLGEEAASDLPPNVYMSKYRRLFEYYAPLPFDCAPRGSIGIPRVLNLYENYPFWFTFFKELGFRVELSSPSSEQLYTSGMETIPSQTVCYPAKLVHGHLLDLVKRGVERFFYPGIQREKKEFHDAHDHFNCPVIAGYPDVSALNINELRGGGLDFKRGFLPLDSPKQLARRLYEEFSDLCIPKREIHRALDAAYSEQEQYKKDIRMQGEGALQWMKETGALGIVIAGHPYHLDPEINHGIPELVNSYGVAVFTEDSILHLAPEEESIQTDVLDQWVYHSRLYRAALAVSAHPSLHLVQLNSFGCGLDAISADQTAKLLEKKGKRHTLIKIDEGRNSGAVRIRVRSLLAALGGVKNIPANKITAKRAHKVSKERTILCPQLSHYHFQFFEHAMRLDGYNLEVVSKAPQEAIEEGLKYVNNDVCYPSIVVVGQLIHALKSGRYDLDSIDCMYAQTGGACRASNYVPLLRKALDEAGFSQVNIIAMNSADERHGVKMKLSAKALLRSVFGLLYGDMLMRLVMATRPYERVKGDANALMERWSAVCKSSLERGMVTKFSSNIREMVAAFASLPMVGEKKPKIGIVGEILAKYNPDANDGLVGIIEDEGGEAVVGDLANFLMYCLYDPVYQCQKLSGSFFAALAGRSGITFLEWLRTPLKKALAGTRFGEVEGIDALAQKAATMVSCGNQAGEGWLLAAEMISFLDEGVKNIICVQPFGCLPNHITGKGVIKELKRRYSGANILPLDYDASLSSVNRLNRIKLLMAGAH